MLSQLDLVSKGQGHKGTIPPPPRNEQGFTQQLHGVQLICQI